MNGGQDRDPNSPPRSPLRQALVRGWHAARHNRYPALLLWMFGLALIVCYFWVPVVHEGLESIRELKERAGIGFSAISTAIFAGIIPFLIPKLAGQGDPGQGIAYLTSNILFWAVKGIEVDLFYRLQALIFGTDADLQTIAAKVAVDQLIYAPLLGLLTVVLFYELRNHDYSFAAVRSKLGVPWIWNEFAPLLISNWFVWLPACGIVYCLPLGLQLPIQNLILCFWVLILTFWTERAGKTADGTGAH